MITDRGNVFPVIGPPPDRPPGFDSAPHLDNHQVDTAYALSAGGAPGAPAHHEFGQAGAFIQLPDHDPARPRMAASIITGWGSASKPLYAPFPVGDLRMLGGAPYLGPARVDHDSMDILALCNQAGSGVSCIDNRQGVDLAPGSTTHYGHVLGLPSTGRTIVHMANVSSVPGDHLEVYFTCPDCRTGAKAYWGTGSAPFAERGFEFTGNVLHYAGRHYPDAQFGPGHLWRLAWGGATTTAGPPGVTYWEHSTVCNPNISVSGDPSHIFIDYFCDPSLKFQIGTALADKWKPLVPGWNSVNATANSFIIVINPVNGAKLQVRSGSHECCTGFDGGLTNMAGRTAVIHNIDRHLLIVPNGGTVPKDHEALKEMREVRWSVREEVRTDTRWLAHDGPGDPVYHGLWYDVNQWPPYKVRLVDVEGTRFLPPAATMSDYMLDYMDWSDYSDDDLREMVQIRPPGGLMDSDVYDVRNGKWLRSNEGRFILWDGTHVQLEYIHPWMGIQKSPVWETFGVGLQEDALTIVERYVTIPVVKPTRMSETYLSSIPCGQPGSEEMGRLWEAMVEAQQLGGYDQHLMHFLILTSHSGPIEENNRLQQIYLASRTYLDYVDGAYLAGDSIHVPVLPNRPYLCTIVAPNILESQYMVYGLPFGETYVSLGGTEGTAFTTNLHDGIGTGYERTMAVQSPRDGVVSLDVTARFGAAVSAVAVGNHSGNIGERPGQWMNGTVRVNATLFVGDENPEEDDGTLLTEFDVDLYGIVDRTFAPPTGGKCYYRFTTVPDDSEYVVSTITANAELGEHIPITLVMEAHGQPLVPRGPFTYAGTGMLVTDEEANSRIVNVSEEGVAGNLTLTLNVGTDADAQTSLNWEPRIAPTQGGTDIILESPSGTLHQMERAWGDSSTYTYNAGALAGEDMRGIWTLHVIDHVRTPATFFYHDQDFWVISWDLEIERASGLEVGELCDETLSESAVVQYLLRTFSIDVR